jgi:hypothetical protein
VICTFVIFHQNHSVTLGLVCEADFFKPRTNATRPLNW